MTMKTTIIILLSLFSMNSFAQIISIWRGNTPGHESKWDCPSNWSNNRLPDEFTDVIIQVDISSTYKYPVLNSKRTEINSLRIWPGASLILKEGNLYVLDPQASYFRASQVNGKGNLVFIDDPHYVSNGEGKNAEK